MKLRFTMFDPEGARASKTPDLGDFAVDPGFIIAVLTIDHGPCKVAILILTNGTKLYVHDANRSAQDRWAEATGDMLEPTDEDQLCRGQPSTK